MNNKKNINNMETSDHAHKIVLKYRRLSRYYDPLFLALERLVFSDNNNPRQALAQKIPTGEYSILDVCTGTGRTALSIADSGCNIVGIDLSPEMLGVANQKIQQQQIPNITFHQMDATDMSFPDEHFDIAVSSFALHEMDHQFMQLVLTEIHRVMKTGGKLHLIEFENDENPMIQAVFSLYKRVFYPPSIQDFFQYDWNGILENAGFNLESIERYRVSKLISAVKFS